MNYTVHGILQARILEWVAFPFSRGSSQPRDQTQVFCIASGILYQLSHKGSPIKKEQFTMVIGLRIVRRRSSSDDYYIHFDILKFENICLG